MVVAFDLRQMGGSALTTEINVPKEGVREGIPVTLCTGAKYNFLCRLLWAGPRLWIPLTFLSASMPLDYSGYPDCRPEYIAAYEKMANLATRAGVEGTGQVHDPRTAVAMTKADIIRKGLSLGVDYWQDTFLL